MRFNYKRLFLKMADQCISNEDLCKKAGVSSATLTKIKSETGSFRPTTVGRIAQALGVTAEYLTDEGQTWANGQ